jgi:ribonuclease-3
MTASFRVLGLTNTEALYHAYPSVPEGADSKTAGLPPNLRLGRGEERTGGRDGGSIIADTLAAVLGAVYLQHGLAVTAEVIRRLFAPTLTDAARRFAGPAGFQSWLHSLPPETLIEQDQEHRTS